MKDKAFLQHQFCEFQGITGKEKNPPAMSVAYPSSFPFQQKKNSNNCNYYYLALHQAFGSHCFIW